MLQLLRAIIMGLLVTFLLFPDECNGLWNLASFSRSCHCRDRLPSFNGLKNKQGKQITFRK